MRFVWFFFFPADSLVRAYHLAHAAEGPSVEVPEAAVCTSFRPVKFRYYGTLPVGGFSGTKYPVRADQGAEIAALATSFVNYQFHDTGPFPSQNRV